MHAKVEIWWIFIGGADLYDCVLEIIKAELCGKTDALIRLKAQWSFPLERRVGRGRSANRCTKTRQNKSIKS